jgi:hypothetical protein
MWSSADLSALFQRSVHIACLFITQAYNVLSTQAANVVGTMEKMWTGAATEGQGSNGGAAGAAQQQARLELALNSSEFAEHEYVQVG